MDEKRIAVAAIVVDEQSAVEEVNKVLHEYSSIIIGRMGLPYKNRRIAIISVIIDAPANEISALSGKLGMIPGVNSKVQYTKA